MKRIVLYLVVCLLCAWSVQVGAINNEQRQNERAELKAILALHHGGHPVDGRKFGLPQNDFDDATNLTVRQRQWFRQLNPNLDYPKSGPVQYPRWAFELMTRLDASGAVVRNGKIYLANVARPLDATSYEPFKVTARASDPPSSANAKWVRDSRGA